MPTLHTRVSLSLAGWLFLLTDRPELNESTTWFLRDWSDVRGTIVSPLLPCGPSSVLFSPSCLCHLVLSLISPLQKQFPFPCGQWGRTRWGGKNNVWDTHTHTHLQAHCIYFCRKTKGSRWLIHESVVFSLTLALRRCVRGCVWGLGTQVPVLVISPKETTCYTSIQENRIIFLREHSRKWEQINKI